MRSLVCFVLSVYLLILIARSLVSYLPSARNGRAGEVLSRLTEPVLAPVRRMLPPVRAGAAAIDLSSLAVGFGIILLRAVIC